MIWHRSAVTIINVTDFILCVKGTVQSIMSAAEVLRLWSTEPLAVVWGEPAGQRADSPGFKLTKDIKT